MATSTMTSNSSYYCQPAQTLLPGRSIDPVKLEDLLNDLFNGHYAVAMKDNSYIISASRKLFEYERKQCY
ncbi:hypothetical protein FDECE_385 [Fusarium decemcellulare]|nr:hypothetical protein FDECE_385 [Fusarium decemcellulare]